MCRDSKVSTESHLAFPGGEDLDFREMAAIAGNIAGEQCQASDGSMRANVEIRQGRGPQALRIAKYRDSAAPTAPVKEPEVAGGFACHILSQLLTVAAQQALRRTLKPGCLQTPVVAHPKRSLIGTYAATRG